MGGCSERHRENYCTDTKCIGEDSARNITQHIELQATGVVRNMLTEFVLHNSLQITFSLITGTEQQLLWRVVFEII